LAGRKAAEQLKLIKRAADALRPLLTPRQCDFLDWMTDLRVINERLRHVGGSLTELRARLGVDKGNASRTIAKLQERLWAILRGFLME
jgi:DNA-binding MarR family transcriptional regulator